MTQRRRLRPRRSLSEEGKARVAIANPGLFLFRYAAKCSLMPREMLRAQNASRSAS